VDSRRQDSVLTEGVCGDVRLWGEAMMKPAILATLTLIAIAGVVGMIAYLLWNRQVWFFGTLIAIAVGSLWVSLYMLWRELL